MRSIALSVALVSSLSFASISGQKWVGAKATYRIYPHAANTVRGITDFTGGTAPKILDMLRTWTGAKQPCTAFDIVYGGFSPVGSGPASALISSNAINDLVWLTQWSEGSGVLGVTQRYAIPGTGQITDADIHFNNATTDWSDGPSIPFNRTDLLSVVLHEAGHSIGVDHTNNLNSVMYPSIAPGQMKRTLDVQTDRTELCAIYPGVGMPGSQGSSCLNNGECKSPLVCRVPKDAPNGTSGICTTDCTSGQACAASYTCQDTSVAGVKACLVPVGSPDLCKFCSGPSDCSSGICLRGGSMGQSPFCSISCTSAASCGNGYQCVPTQSGSNLCVPANQTITCTNQCSATSPCPIGFICSGGTCTPSGNPGDRCEISGYCKSCSVCTFDDPQSNYAFCRTCCLGTASYCQGCPTTSCAAGSTCSALTQGGVVKANVCVQTGGVGECQSCSTSVPCKTGFSCVAGRCHTACNPANPGSCTACYDLGGGTGVCGSCSGEQGTLGQACGAAGSSIVACRNDQGLVCVGAPKLCKKSCNPSNPVECDLSREACQTVDGKSVCVATSSAGQVCSACSSSHTCDPGLICYSDRCYTPCKVGQATCGSCLATNEATGDGVCTCADQVVDVNQACGNVQVSVCRSGLSCVAGYCRAQCDPAAPSCAPGLSCLTGAGGVSYCQDPSNPNGGGGGGDPTMPGNGGCGCGTGAGAALAFAAPLLLAPWRRRRRA